MPREMSRAAASQSLCHQNKAASTVFAACELASASRTPSSRLCPSQPWAGRAAIPPGDFTGESTGDGGRAGESTPEGFGDQLSG